MTKIFFISDLHFDHGKKEANENMVRAKKMIYQNVIDGEFPVWMKVCSFIILRSGL